MSTNEETKKCSFCAEEVKSEAVKCKHCGERLDQKISTPSFEKFEEWLKQSYPAYKVVSKNSEENFVVLNKEHKSFNGFVFVILLLLWVFPGIIYALVTMSGKKIITLTVYFDEKGTVDRVSDSGFGFLGRKYNESRGFESSGELSTPSSTPEEKKNKKTLSLLVKLILVIFVVGSTINFIASAISQSS